MGYIAINFSLWFALGRVSSSLISIILELSLVLSCGWGGMVFSETFSFAWKDAGILWNRVPLLTHFTALLLMWSTLSWYVVCLFKHGLILCSVSTIFHQIWPSTNLLMSTFSIHFLYLHLGRKHSCWTWASHLFRTRTHCKAPSWQYHWSIDPDGRLFSALQCALFRQNTMADALRLILRGWRWDHALLVIREGLEVCRVVYRMLLWIEWPLFQVWLVKHFAATRLV